MKRNKVNFFLWLPCLEPLAAQQQQQQQQQQRPGWDGLPHLSIYLSI
jgi:hypothetical protein